MTFLDLTNSLTGDKPPDGIPSLLQSLWHDAKGNWSEAHQVAQDLKSSDGAWVHAYLHRKEGDPSNAAYWYQQAGKKFPSATLSEEFETILRDLLRDS